MFGKVLVANRGEIAVRAFRAAYELGVRTVAVFPYEDRNAIHRIKADEAYLIGERGHPVRAYLDIDVIMRAAKESEADAIYPGYGFLSENPDLARACADAGITFIGPPATVLELAGNKVRAIEAARAAGVPTLKSTPPSADPQELIVGAEAIGFPVFVKAVAGGGGRGMRRVGDRKQLREAIAAAMREAEGAFGDPTAYIEQAVGRPRHIEAQVLADTHGNTIHLFERDCSVQGRHQKIVEIAPAPHITTELREALCGDAVRFAESINYSNAGTVEFLVETEGERAGQHVFIEMNPRIQVEHTITEEITDVDLVQAQMRIAAGESLADLDLSQEAIRINGAALQCRITTEDPANDFRPDTGTITAYRSAGGAGVRIDGGTVDIGVEISAYFDSLLVKLICHGRDFEAAVTRARRALAEFRIRGVSTNIPFLQAVLEDEDFMAGDVSTSFIDERPELLTTHAPADRGTKLLRWLAEVTVNQPHGPAPTQLDPGLKRPALDITIPSPLGSRQRLVDLGPEAFAADLRKRVPVEVTDTTFRDAHQSLLATRVRTKDLIRISPYVGRMTPQLLSVECWGGATYDVALRFIAEDPWERLAALRYNMPGLCLQMLLRGRNTVGYTPYPTKVTTSFVAEAAEVGIDIFRIFDALNDVEQMRPAIEAVRETGSTIAEVALCYTGDLNSPSEDLYTHDYAGGQLATLLAAIEVGVDAVDVASAPMAGTTSQVPASALVAACANTERPTNLDLRAVMELEPYWEAVRKVYAPFESGLPSPTGRVYDHEIPGGQLSNLRQQAIALGLGEKFEQIEAMYTAASAILGRPPKVTPSSKVVGDLALHLVAVGADPDDFAENPQHYDIPDSVIGFLSGELGDPPGGWPEPFRTKALQGRTVPVRDIELSTEDSASLDDKGVVRQGTLNRLLFPGPTKEFLANRETYGDVGRLDTLDFLYGLQPGQEHVAKIGKGVSLILGLSAIGSADERGMRTVMCTINGQLRPIRVRDKSIKVDVKAAERADPSKPGQVAAPFAGVVTVTVIEGDQVEAGATVATIEAMKMEAAITSPVTGVVQRLAIASVQQVEGGDLVLVIAPE